MNNETCPFCKEEIKTDAIICKHCHTRLYRTRQEKLMAAITEQFYQLPRGQASGPACEGFCYYMYYRNNNFKLKECLKECKAEAAIAAVAARLHRELYDTFIEIIWAGGDIDPVPFEKTVRERFSHPKDVK